MVDRGRSVTAGVRLRVLGERGGVAVVAHAFLPVGDLLRRVLAHVDVAVCRGEVSEGLARDAMGDVAEPLLLDVAPVVEIAGGADGRCGARRCGHDGCTTFHFQSWVQPERRCRSIYYYIT